MSTPRRHPLDVIARAILAPVAAIRVPSSRDAIAPDAAERVTLKSTTTVCLVEVDELAAILTATRRVAG